MDDVKDLLSEVSLKVLGLTYLITFLHIGETKIIILTPLGTSRFCSSMSSSGHLIPHAEEKS